MRFEHPPSNREVPEGEIPTGAREALRPTVVLLESEGFRARHFYVATPPDVTLYGLLMLSSDGLVAANVQAADHSSGVRQVAIHLGSEDVRGFRYSTSSNRPMLLDPPEFDARHFPGASAENVLQQHRARVTMSLVDLSGENLFDRQRRTAIRWLEFQVERGVLFLVR
jgi:hypothetical protein